MPRTLPYFAGASSNGRRSDRVRSVAPLSRLALLCLLSGLAVAVSAEDRKRGFGLYMDQDMFLPVVNEDRDYTMGVAMEFFEQDRGIYPLDRLMKALGERLKIHQPGQTIRRSYLFGAINYTPDDLSQREVIPDDRPYASVLYLANKRVFADDQRALGIEGQVGLLGTYVARAVQTQLHRWWRDVSGGDDPVDPQGWKNQISAGGEPTARLRVAISELLLDLNGPVDVDLSGTGDVSLGYQTNASLGLAARVGRLNSPFWSLPYDPINRGNFVPAFGDSELYFWAAYRARAVGYDALLQGQFRDSAFTYRGKDLKRLVHEAGFGVTGAYDDVQLTLSANMKSAEINRGQGERTHWWGGLYLTWQY